MEFTNPSGVQVEGRQYEQRAESRGPGRDTAAPAARARNAEHAVWLTAEDAVQYLGLCSRMALYKAVRRGHLRAHRLGRRLRFRRSELDDALDGR